MNPIELIPMPSFPLDTTATEFRDRINTQWAEVQNAHAKLMARRQELDAVAPDKMDGAHVKALRKLKGEIAENLRAQLPILREVGDWQDTLMRLYTEHRKATAAAHEAAIADIQQKLKEIGFVDHPGTIQTLFYAKTHPQCRRLLNSMLEAQAAPPAFSTYGIDKMIETNEETLRRAVESCAAA